MISDDNFSVINAHEDTNAGRQVFNNQSNQHKNGIPKQSQGVYKGQAINKLHKLDEAKASQENQKQNQEPE